MAEAWESFTVEGDHRDDSAVLVCRVDGACEWTVDNWEWSEAVAGRHMYFTLGALRDLAVKHAQWHADVEGT